MKKIILCSLCVLIGLAASAQKNVAVYVTCDEATKKYKEDIYYIFVNPFVTSENYRIVEKSETALRQMNNELSHQREGLVESDEIVKMGHNIGVQYLCVIEVKYLDGKNIAYIHLNDLEKAEVVRSQRATFVSTDDLGEVAYQIANWTNRDAGKRMGEERQLTYQQFKQRVTQGSQFPDKPFGCLDKDYNTAKRYYNKYQNIQYAGNALLWTGFGLGMADLLSWGIIGIVHIAGQGNQLSIYNPAIKQSLIATSIVVAAPLLAGAVVHAFAPISLHQSYKYFSKVNRRDVSVIAIPFAAPESAGLGFVVNF